MNDVEWANQERVNDVLYNRIVKIEAMLAEICHNCENPYIDQCYVKRYETKEGS